MNRGAYFCTHTDFFIVRGESLEIKKMCDIVGVREPKWGVFVKEKIRFFISVFCIAAMALTAFAGCNANDETVTDGEKENQKIEQTVAEEKPYVIDYQVVNVGDVSAISDSDGIRILNEVSGEEILVFEGEADSMAFNGEMLYFFMLDCKDETFETYYVDEETGEREPAGETWEYAKLYSYSLATEELNEVFDGNSYRSTLIYLDENYIYFTDLKDEFVGDITMMLDYNREHFYRYDINTGEKTTVLKDIGVIKYVDGNFVYQSDRYMNGDQLFHPTHIYNIKSGESYDIDECAQFAYADNEKIYYLTQEETEHSFDYNLESCSFTGTDKELVSELDFLATEADYDVYTKGEKINFNDWGDKNADFIFNIVTDEAEEYNFDTEEDESETFVKETANGYYVENYDYDYGTSTITFHKGEVKE